MRSNYRFLFFLAASVISCSSAVAETLCKPHEVVYFSCKLAASAKVVSLCGDPLKDADYQPVPDFWLQYRFGRPAKLELVYPEDRKGQPVPFKKANFQAQYARHNRGFDIEISFTNHGFAYSVSRLEGAESEKNHFYGVTVASVNSNSAVTPRLLRCQDLPEGATEFSALAQEYESGK